MATIVSKEEEGMDAYVQTCSGLKIYFLNPHPDMFIIEDIAHSLGNQCRFTGHTKEFYSVAQHSVIVSEILERQGYDIETQKEGLLHDSPEYVLADVAGPIKICANLGEYQAMEKLIHDKICEKFCIAKGVSPAVKNADLIALFTEKRDCLGEASANMDWKWGDNVPRDQEIIIKWTPKQAQTMFMNRFNKLFNK